MLLNLLTFSWGEGKLEGETIWLAPTNEAKLGKKELSLSLSLSLSFTHTHTHTLSLALSLNHQTQTLSRSYTRAHTGKLSSKHTHTNTHSLPRSLLSIFYLSHKGADSQRIFLNLSLAGLHKSTHSSTHHTLTLLSKLAWTHPYTHIALTCLTHLLPHTHTNFLTLLLTQALACCISQTAASLSPCLSKKTSLILRIAYYSYLSPLVQWAVIWSSLTFRGCNQFNYSTNG